MRMARRKTRSWFLLKDSAIYGIVNLLLIQMHLEYISSVSCRLINGTTVEVDANNSNHGNKSSIINSSKENSSLIVAENVISEKVVIPGSDPEREARLLYEKSLKELSSTFVNDVEDFQKICGSWVKRGCQCKGDSNSIVLSCKGISITQIPKDLPNKTTNL